MPDPQVTTTPPAAGAPSAMPAASASPTPAVSGAGAAAATPAQAAPAPAGGPSPAGTAPGETQPAANESVRDKESGRFTKRPELPGVHTQRDIKPIRTFKDRQAQKTQPTSADEGKPEQPKGADGSVPPPPGSPAQPTDPTAAKPSFKFAGKDWESSEQAENSFRTLQGIHSSQKRQIAQLSRENQQNQYSATQWKAHAESLQARLDAHGAGQPTEPGKPGSAGTANTAAAAAAPAGFPESADDVLKNVDLGLVEEIANEKGPLVAAYTLTREALDHVLKSVRAEFDRVRQPFENFQTGLRLSQQLQSVVSEVASYEQPGPDGNPVPVYGELSEPEALKAISSIWEKLGFTDDTKGSPMALVTAILHYRNMKGLQGGVAAPAAGPASASNLPPAASGASAAAAAVTAQLTGASGADALAGPGLRAVRPTDRPESAADRIRREVREAPSPDPELGFVRRRAK